MATLAHTNRVTASVDLPTPPRLDPASSRSKVGLTDVSVFVDGQKFVTVLRTEDGAALFNAIRPGAVMSLDGSSCTVTSVFPDGTGLRINFKRR
jgi:hypothetical protein